MGKYVQDNEWGTKYPNFRKEEFKCPCCGKYGNGIASSLVQNLQALRNKYGNLIVTSGYRCPAYNKRVGGSTNSAHLLGQAADFYFASGILGNQNTRIAVINEIKKMPNYHYSYCNINGNYPNMGSAIHIDTILVDDEEKKIKHKIGDIVNINCVYISSDSTNKIVPAITRGKITRIIEGARNPYLLDDGNIGWINDDCIINGTMATYIVKSGDTLSGIAKKYNTTWQEIYEKNKSVIGDNPNLIKPGQVLKF